MGQNPNISISLSTEKARKEIKQLKIELTGIQKEFKLSSETMKNTASVNDKLSAKVQSLSKQLETQTNITSKIKEAIEKANIAWEKSSIQVETAKQKLKEAEEAGTYTSKEIKNLHKELETAEKIFYNNSVAIKNWKNELTDSLSKEEKLKNAIGETSSELKRYELEMESINKKIKDLADSFQNGTKSVDQITNLLDNAGKSLTLKLTKPLMDIGKTAAKSAIDFETAFAGLSKTVDASDEELESLKQGIREMSYELPSSAVSIAGVAEAAGQLAIKKENILGFTRTMIDLGESTNLSSDEAAMSLAKFANVVSMSQEDFDRLGSVIVDLGNTTATTESDIVSMATRLASAGAQVNMPVSDIMALAAALSSVGIEAEAGGSSFSKVMLDIQMAVQKGEEAVVDFAGIANISTSEFIKLFNQDATSAILAFVDGLGRIENAAEVLDSLGLAEIRVRDSLLRASNATTVFKEALETGKKAWEDNTALANEASKRYETTESKVSILKNTINDMAIELSDNFLPIIQDIVVHIGDFIKGFSNLDESTQESIVKFGLLATGIGPVTGAVSNLIKVMSGLSRVVKNVGGISEILGGVLSSISNPIGITAIAATALTGVIINHIKAQEEQRQALINSKEALENISNTYKETCDNASSIQELSQSWQDLNEIIQSNRLNADELAEAKSKLAEIESQLITNSDGLISSYDIENGKISEKIELLKEQSEIQKEIAKIDFQQQLNSIDIDKLQEENQTLENRQEALIKEISMKQEAYSKLKLLEEEYITIISNNDGIANLEEQTQKLQEISDKATEIGNQIGLNFSDNLSLILGSSDELNEELGYLNDKLQQVSEEYNSSTESIEEYYQSQLKLIELDLGGTIDEQTNVLYLMALALDDLNTSGIISNEIFEYLKAILPELSQNEVDAHNNTLILKSGINELYEKLLNATASVDDLNNSITGLPSEKKVDILVGVKVNGIDNLASLVNVPGIGNTVKMMLESSAKVNDTNSKPIPKVSYTPASSGPSKKSSSSSARNDAEKKEREAEKKRQEQLKAWEKHWKDREEQSKEWISTEKFYNRLSYDEEVSAYGRLIEYLKEALNEIETLEFATEEEKLELKKDFNKKIVNYEKDQYTASKNLVKDRLSDEEDIRDKKINNLEDEISEQDSLIDEVKLYTKKRKQLETNMTSELDSINEMFWLNEKERLKEAEKIYENYSSNIKKIDKDIYTAKKEMITKAANDMKTTQLDSIDSEINALEKAYKKQTEVIQRAKAEKINAINEQSKAAMNALENEHRQAENNYNAQIKMIESSGKTRIEALQAEIEAITQTARSEDRSYDLNKLEELYQAYSQSSTSEGQERAEELRRQIRDLNNEEKIEDINQQISAIEKETENQKEQLQIQYENQTNAYEAQKSQLQSYYDSMISQTETYYDDLLDKIAVNYETEKELLEEKKYVIEETNRQILENVDNFANENINLYGQNQDDILALLRSKEGAYYNTAKALGQAYYDGLQEEMERVNSYIRRIAIPDMPSSLLAITPSATSLGNGNVNNYNLSVNDYGDKNFKDDIDIESYNKELGNTLINKTKYGFGW